MPLNIHFLNVGHGDCTIIEHPSGRISMIDINNSQSLPETDVDALAHQQGLSLNAFRASGFGPQGFRTWEDYYRSLLVDPTEWYQQRFGGRSVFRYIQTHPDMDHMSGLHRFFYQERIPIENMWDTAHTKELDKGSFDKTRYAYEDWAVYQLMRLGTVRDDSPRHQVLNLLRGASSRYYEDDQIQVLAPTADLVEYASSSEDWNNSSYVLKVTHAGRSVILPGDAEKPVWDKIESFDDPVELSCDVLKAPHHGRESGYSKSATSLMSPRFVVCSVGKKPSTDASDEYASHGAAVLSTRYHGTITLTIGDDGSLTVRDRNGSVIGTAPGRAAA